MTAPKHLSAAARKWWSLIVDEYDLDGDTAGVLLLTKAAEAWDRAERCRKRIDADGEVLIDRFGQPKPHPLLAAERDARSQFLAALKAMNLDLEPLAVKPGRPAGR